MTNDEFLATVAFDQGVAAGIAGKSPHPDVRALAARFFWKGPWYFALVDLARRHPDEFAALADAQKLAACNRYGAESWDAEEPKVEGL